MDVEERKRREMEKNDENKRKTQGERRWNKRKNERIRRMKCSAFSYPCRLSDEQKINKTIKSRPCLQQSKGNLIMTQDSISNSKNWQDKPRNRRWEREIWQSPTHGSHKTFNISTLRRKENLTTTSRRTEGKEVENGEKDHVAKTDIGNLHSCTRRGARHSGLLGPIQERQKAAAGGRLRGRVRFSRGRRRTVAPLFLFPQEKTEDYKQDQCIGERDRTTW